MLVFLCSYWLTMTWGTETSCYWIIFLLSVAALGDTEGCLQIQRHENAFEHTESHLQHFPTRSFMCVLAFWFKVIAEKKSAKFVLSGVCCEHLVICLGLKFHSSGNKVELWISPIHLHSSKYSAIPATSSKVFNSWEESFCPQEGIKQVCIHQNKPLKFRLSKGRQGHAGWVQRQQVGRDALLHTPECQVLWWGHRLSHGNECPQLQAAAGDCSSQESRVPHEILADLMAFQQSNVLPCSRLSCTHWASEESLGRSLSPAWGWAPGSTAWEGRKGQMNEMQRGLVRFGCCCINSSIYLCIKIFTNHTLQFQQRNSPKMSWFHELN